MSEPNFLGYGTKKDRPASEYNRAQEDLVVNCCKDVNRYYVLCPRNPPFIAQRIRECVNR